MYLFIDAHGSVWACLTEDNPVEVGESFVVGTGLNAIDAAIELLENAAKQLRQADMDGKANPGYHAEVITP